MEQYFSKYRKGIIGYDSFIRTPNHASIPLVYADWTASGRLYLPIEERLRKELMPFVANTHTETNYTGSLMTIAYHQAQEIIKSHVGAHKEDVLISSDSGMTGVVNKFQRILGLRIHESFKNSIQIKEIDKPVVFITHMEHHSNQTSWLETIADVVVVPPNGDGLVSLNNFKEKVAEYGHRKLKIAAITSCSNVTGIMTPYFEIASLMHQNNGLCFVDFACSAPYVDINMHPEAPVNSDLDAIYFSPHKFLGGPGSTGVLVFNRRLYSNNVPDNPGGGTVDWTNPWGEHKYLEDIEAREDGGTPAFLQTIKAAMCMQLKEEMGVDNIQKRENEILDIIWPKLSIIPNLHLLAADHRDRLGVISFYIDDLHYNLAVKMLNDRYGIQTRGGCSCAGTYGHYLLHVTQENSKSITDKIDEGDYSFKPGWIRLSIHPTHTNSEIEFMLGAIKDLAENHEEWSKEYEFDTTSGNIFHSNNQASMELRNKLSTFFSKAFA
ncbi:aminotransferase class V-fold PLP-dependent enzyme [Marivirga harenae]|uniref:aminotransferase class V-fold PLP-dependent enzyme n=1 Tax=Marivirga harenae TaxID=2010992 RepID=UPI0026DF0A54|nr:aminotransferase class V-fold PLP-dependent enzyme [Marivirga harenae]WKV13029.1 aminotransferase class V-fold PLP-dependent enzyme [Marivirga harenae]